MNRNLIKLMLKAQLATAGFLLVLLIFTGLILGLLGWYQFSLFQKSSGLTTTEILRMAKNAWQIPLNNPNNRISILVLGLDEVEARSQTILTDTLILLTMNLKTGEIDSLSLPRDLWIEEYQTKINSLYYYGQKADPEQPTNLVASVIESLSGISIDKIIPVNLEQLAELIDTIGGLEITVAQAFTDDHFPIPGLNPSQITDPTLLQQTVSFEAGTQTMSGDRVLEYIRSRQAIGENGSDDSRTRRQQQVIVALLAKLQSKSVLSNPDLLGRLVAWYGANYESYWPLSEILQIGIQYVKSDLRPKITTHTLPIAKNYQEYGILIHPPIWKYQNQWVYIATDSAILKEYIQSSFNLYPTSTPQ